MGPLFLPRLRPHSPGDLQERKGHARGHRKPHGRDRQAAFRTAGGAQQVPCAAHRRPASVYGRLRRLLRICDARLCRTDAQDQARRMGRLRSDAVRQGHRIRPPQAEDRAHRQYADRQRSGELRKGLRFTRSNGGAHRRSDAAAAAQGHGKAAVYLQCNGRAVHGHRGKDARIYLQWRYLSGGSVAAVYEPLCRQPALRISRAPHHQSLAVHGVPFR